MEKKRSLGEGPLPGDRQGILGAIAEDGSVRDDGDSVLSRRAAIDKCAIAESNKTFVRHETIGDGSCLFRAVSLYLYGNQDHHEQLRQDSIKYIEENWSELKNHILLDNNKNPNKRNYCRQMRKTSTYGTSIEILALSEIYQINFHVYSIRNIINTKTIEIIDPPTIISKRPHNKIINLLLIGNPAAGHFELLKPYRETNEETSIRNTIEDSITNTTPMVFCQKTENERTAESVLLGQPTTTKAGTLRQRLTWTREMNYTVMRCYYFVTKMETINTGYRIELHNLFTKFYPHLAGIVTPQRLIDQKRVIIKNNRLTTHDLQNIKEEVAKEMEDQHLPKIPTREENNVQIDVSVEKPENHTDTRISPSHTPQRITTIDNGTKKGEDEMEKNIRHEMETNLLIWKNSDPTKRPALPKLQYKTNTQNLIKIMNNQVINTVLDDSCTLEDIHTTIYAAATTILTLNNQKISPTQRKISNEKPRWQRRLENKIINLRATIGRLTQYTMGNRSKKNTQTVTQHTTQ